jgi:hypothetical protein
MLILPKKIGWKSHYSGIDSLELCNDRHHFLNYSKKITYEYNSKGFRDHEWPTDLNDVIWCIGDSFTVGLGQPFEETWPSLLQKNIGRRCLNLGEDGCSNDTMSLRIKMINELYNPKLIIVMWSYFHRRRVKNNNVHYEKNTFSVDEDIKNFKKNFQIVDNLQKNTLHLLVPNAFINFEHFTKKIFNKLMLKYNVLTEEQIKKILIYKQMDYSRDYHHFDIKTSECIVNLLMKKINDFDK